MTALLRNPIAQHLPSHGHKIEFRQWSALLLAALTLWLASGCGQGSAPKATLKGPTTPLEQTISLWSSGSTNQALDAFLKLDFSQQGLFSTGSVLGCSESEFAALPQKARDESSKQMMEDLRALKELCNRVAQKGREFKAKGDATNAQQCFKQVEKCGESLEKPNRLKVEQLIGKSVKKLAGKELGAP
jgi:hypothetical protein